MRAYTTADFYTRFATRLPGTEQGQARINRYPNGELHAIVDKYAAHEDCVIVGSVAPPDEQLLSLLMLADALRQSGAASIHAFLPYLGYARQDKTLTTEDGGIEFVGTLLRAAGIDSITTMDVHSAGALRLLRLPAVSIDPASLFAPHIARLGWDDVTVVAPDEGARPRAQALAQHLGIHRPVTYFIKKHIDGITHLECVGDVSAHVVIADDILDTGRTLLSACRILKDHGVQNIAIAVTHSLFTGASWKQLFTIGVEALFTTDSCPEAERHAGKGIHIIPITPLLNEVSSFVTRKESSCKHRTSSNKQRPSASQLTTSN